MEIYPGIKVRDLGLYIVKEKTLIIADLHLGYEETLNKQGVMVPRFSFEDLKKRILNIMEDVEVVVINGDLKHEFGKIMSTEWRYSKDLLEMFKDYKIIFVQGNHDRIIKPIIKNMELVDEYKIGDILITHGDQIKDIDSKVIIIGHEHCAVALKDGVRVEKFKCFLKGKFERKVLIAMPSCNLLTEGTDVLRESRLSPYLQQKLDNFEVYIVSDKIYDFGKVKDL